MSASSVRAIAADLSVALSLGAAPAFAAMALLIGANGGAESAMSSHSGSPLGGMSLMYWLMTGFHLSPWLRLVSRRQSSRRA